MSITEGNTMNVAKLFGFADKQDIAARLQAIEPAQIKDAKLRNRFEKIRNKQGGFTLLELLVVVAILAAIAGTATIMLQDTDRKASAAAHVAMMDELSKGIQTFRVLNNGQFPNNWESLQVEAAPLTGAAANRLAIINTDLAGFLDAAPALTAADVKVLNNNGITALRTLNPAARTGACANTTAALTTLIANKALDVTNSNVFQDPPVAGADQGKGGCGAQHTIAANDVMLRWVANENYRVGAAAGDTLYAVGIGQNMNLFTPGQPGAMSTVPLYRHVSATEYNHFIALLALRNNEVQLQAIIDGSGDTKDEELGEQDGTRSTL